MTSPTEGVIATSPGKSIIMGAGPTPYDSLVTSVATQIINNTEQIGTPASSGVLTSLMAASDSSPSTKSDFSDRVPEEKGPTEESATQNDVTYSTKNNNSSDLNSSTKTVSVPLTVKEISEEKPVKIGDMVVPPGPAPPVTGMVPQEMVKMTDNDLISYINPSCFDQG